MRTRPPCRDAAREAGRVLGVEVGEVTGQEADASGRDCLLIGDSLLSPRGIVEQSIKLRTEWVSVPPRRDRICRHRFAPVVRKPTVARCDIASTCEVLRKDRDPLRDRKSTRL